MQFPFHRLGLGLWSLALAVVLVMVLAGIYAADRALSQAIRQQTSLEAVEAAARVENFLVVQARTLNIFHRLYTAPGTVDPRYSRALVDVLAERMPGFRRLWVTDSAGVIVEELSAGDDPPVIPTGVDLGRVAGLYARSAARRARATREPQVSGPGTLFSNEPGFVIIDPLFVGDRFAGFLGASVSSEALLASLVRRKHPALVQLLVRAGPDSAADTIAVARFRDVPEGALRQTATAEVPGGDRWTVEVLHVGRGGGARATLWGVGLAALAVVVVAFVQERGERIRTAERSRELERLSAELLRANRAKSEFLANVSHELRTPLNAIVGFVDLLKDGVYGELGPRQVGPVDRIAVSANHLRHLVDQVLDLGKIAAGRIEVHAEPVALRPFVFGVASEVEPLITERGLTLSLSVGASLPRVRTDPALLRQILINLLGNAVKYTPAGSIGVRGRLVGAPSDRTSNRRLTPTSDSLALRAKAPRPDGVWVALQVSDTGVGVAPPDHARIFEEFEQVDAGPRGDSIHRGTGLGLTISRRLARLLGGEITLESEQGKGSTFTLWLPVNPSDLSVEGTRRTPTGSLPVVREG